MAAKGDALHYFVTASKDGFTDGTAETAARTVSKLSTSVNGSLDSNLLFGTRTVGYYVEVSAPLGVVPSGQVTIYDGSRLVQTATLAADGTVDVTLTGLSRGLHLITVRYAGTDALAGSRSLFPDILLVL